MATATSLHDNGMYLEEESPGPGVVARFYARYYRPVLGATGVLTLLVLWQWFGTADEANELFTSYPTKVVATGWDLVQNGELAGDIAISGREFLSGFGLAIVTGIPLGLLMGRYRPVNALFDPLVSFFYATPRIALLPLMIIWLGIGINSKIAVVFLGAVFAILINTLAGVNNLDEALLRRAHSFGANEFQIFRTIALPGSVPFILSGLRLGLGHALVGVVVGELYAATAGVGYLIAVAGNTFQTEKVMVGVLIIAGMGVIFTTILKRIENHFQSWRPQRA